MIEDFEKHKMDEYLNSQIEKINLLTHFYKGNCYDFTSLKEDYIWFSDLNDFNDPFEVVIQEGDFDFKLLNQSQMVSFLMSNRFIKLTDGKVSIVPAELDRKIVEKIVDKNFLALSEPINKMVMEYVGYFKNNKFQCFSHDAKNKDIVKSRLMWSHYARGLRGFAVEFDFNPLLDSMSKLNDGFFNKYSLINYTDLGFNDYIAKVIDEKKPLFVDRMIFSKHTDWEYEQEARIMMKRNEGFYHPACMSRIIIGQKMEEDNIEKLIKILDSKGMLDKLYIAKFDRKDFSISIEKYD
ncbi:DUF2971 domain-containing protein [Pantoea ananatis]|uniref:DUF2971 domain-containing protein n=1 Tax=Pantoea ananas TaxID=553 RepID=UPI00197D2763|nr:DUF2971 domain-containing protein [Pantoea ananatis]MBN6033224.1 DUF2971 domain-containing protein [Pantoea ananatis]